LRAPTHLWVGAPLSHSNTGPKVDAEGGMPMSIPSEALRQRRFHWSGAQRFAMSMPNYSKRLAEKARLRQAGMEHQGSKSPLTYCISPTHLLRVPWCTLFFLPLTSQPIRIQAMRIVSYWLSIYATLASNSSILPASCLIRPCDRPWRRSLPAYGGG
jgi:hypothetical protein